MERGAAPRRAGRRLGPVHSDSSSPNRVEAGFSGAPVWDPQAGGVVGMIVQADVSPDVPAAYLLPTQTLRACLPDLADVVRDAGPFRSLDPSANATRPGSHGHNPPATLPSSWRTRPPPSSAPPAAASPPWCSPGCCLVCDREGLEIVHVRPAAAPLENLAEALLPQRETGRERVRHAARIVESLRGGGMRGVVSDLLEEFRGAESNCYSWSTSSRRLCTKGWKTTWTPSATLWPTALTPAPASASCSPFAPTSSPWS